MYFTLNYRLYFTLWEHCVYLAPELYDLKKKKYT